MKRNLSVSGLQRVTPERMHSQDRDQNGSRASRGIQLLNPITAKLFEKESKVHTAGVTKLNFAPLYQRTTPAHDNFVPFRPINQRQKPDLSFGASISKLQTPIYYQNPVFSTLHSDHSHNPRQYPNHQLERNSMSHLNSPIIQSRDIIVHGTSQNFRDSSHQLGSHEGSHNSLASNTASAAQNRDPAGPAMAGMHTISIEPKYVAEIESNLGGLRRENAELLENNQALEARCSKADSEVRMLTMRVEQMQEDCRELASLRAKLRQQDAEIQSNQSKLEANREQLMKLRQEIFQNSFDRFAFESNLRENSNLREHVGQLSAALETLRNNFDQYAALAGLSPDALKQQATRNTELQTVPSYITRESIR